MLLVCCERYVKFTMNIPSFRLLVVLLLLTGKVLGQSSAATFAASSGTYTNITGGTALWTTTFDDNVSAAITIPSFTYNCVAYTQIYVSSNGFITFGSAPSTTNYTPISGTEGSGVISPFGADLANAGSGTREVRYLNVSASNEFVIQWRDVRRLGMSGERISFQIRLNYSTNVIRFVYGGTISANAATTPTVQVGLRGSSNADFNNRTTTTNWGTATAGAVNTATCQYSNGVVPASGQTYTWTQPGAMTFVSSTTAQAATTSVQKCSSNQEILRVEVVVAGCTSPLSLTQLQINMTGSTIAGTNTNDVSLIHVYYTGTSSTFSTATAFDGAGTSVASGTISINGSQVLTAGTNYFWVAYDLNSASATVANVLDGQCTALTVGGTGRTPSTTNPAGTRAISACAGSPGGVSSGLTVWYKTDNTSTLTMGTGVSSWETSAGSAGSWPITQSTGSQQPAVISGATSPKLFNYNPRLDFVAASNTFLSNTSTATDLMTASGSFFIISDRNVDNFTGFTYTTNTSSYRQQFKPSFRSQSSDASVNGWTFDWSGSTEYSDFAANLTTTTGSGATQSTRKNSVALTASNSNDNTYSPAIATGMYVGRNGLGGEDTDANMAEIILYNVTPSATDINKIESYLAIKYGLTRGGNTGTAATYNYIASDGTTIWNKTTNSGYNRDIAGIGRDDASALFQKQSSSVNNNEPVTIGLSTIAASNATNAATFSADKSFLVWGNNGSASQVTSNAVCYANLPSGIYARIERVWKAQVTNFSQTVTVGFETSMLVNYTAISNLRLLMDDDGSDWTNATIVSGAVINGSRVEFSGVTLAGAKPFFTLASTTNLTPLPVELLAFEAVKNTANTAKIEWTTASEMNCESYGLEKSTDGNEWTLLEKVQGSGTTTEAHTYTVFDPNPAAGYNYYRLNQTDYNGTTREYGIRSLRFEDEAGFTAYPNPANDRVMLLFNDNRTHEVVLYDFTGRQMLRTEINKQGEIILDHLESGVYWIRTETGEELKLMVTGGK